MKKDNTRTAEEKTYGEREAEYMLARALRVYPRQRICAAITSGILLTLAFPPLNWSFLAWFALVPLFLVNQPLRWWWRLVVGYLFGYVHYSTNLLWLNEVGFGAGFLLAGYCALYPMLWYCYLCALTRFFKDPALNIVPFTGLRYLPMQRSKGVFCLLAACGWVALEWVRGVLFTGFPWNCLGISQHLHPQLIQIASITGVYGVSFMIVLVNAAVAVEIIKPRPLIYLVAHGGGPGAFPSLNLHLLFVILAFLPVVFMTPARYEQPYSETLKTLVVQGDLPQQRSWTEEMLTSSMTTYETLTKNGLETCTPDLIVWPEAAIPAPLNYQDYRTARNRLLREVGKPFLIGATHYRENPVDGEAPLVFNSVFLLDSSAPAEKCFFSPADYVVDYYDKVHRVPFGEYTPGASLFPWLPEVIGMGRDLTPGAGFHCVTLPKGLRAGVNICFEDAFADVSRAFVRDGAQVLMTVTNDSWYNRSCGAEQHFSQMVFRAIENRRYFLRCGSNSHTCLIQPNGKVTEMLRDDEKDSDFIAASHCYDVPIIPISELEITFYTRFGDVFAYACVLGTVVMLSLMAARSLKRRSETLKVAKQDV